MAESSKTYAQILYESNQRQLAKTGVPIPLPPGVKLTVKKSGEPVIHGLPDLYKPENFTSPLNIRHRELKRIIINENWRRLRALVNGPVADRRKGRAPIK